MILIDKQTKTVHCTAPILEKIVEDDKEKIKIHFAHGKEMHFTVMDNIWGDSEIIDGVEVPDLSVKYKYVDGQFIALN